MSLVRRTQSLVTVLVTLAVCIVVGSLFALKSNWKPVLTWYLSEKLGTPIVFGDIAVTTEKLSSLRDPWHIDISDIHVANRPWGTTPDMLYVKTLHASLDPSSLLAGHLVLQQLIIDGFDMTLERDADGRGNWKKSSLFPATKPSLEEHGRRSRESLPSIRKLSITNSKIRFHTSSGTVLKIDFKDFDLHTDGEDKPVLLTVNGSYNDIPVILNITTQSFEAFHDPRLPFEADITGEAASMSLRLKTAMIDPLNFDGVKSDLEAHVKNVGRVAALFGSEFSWKKPVDLTSTLSRDGDHWQFDDARGALAGNKFEQSSIILLEGSRKEPDDVKLDIRFGALDINSIQSTGSEENPALQGLNNALEPEADPSTLVDLRLTASRLIYDALTATDFHAVATVKAKSLGIEEVSGKSFDGEWKAQLMAKRPTTRRDIAADIEFRNIDSGKVLESFRMSNESLKGRINGHFKFEASGNSVTELERTATGYAGVSMVGGEISKRAMRLASTDLRGLFTKDTSFTSLTCLLSLVTFMNGQGDLAPFELMSASGTVFGNGRFDLPAESLDVTLRSDPKSTSLFALDVPVHIHGDIGSPTITPGDDSEPSIGRRDISGTHLPTDLRSYAQNPCYPGDARQDERGKP